MSKEQNMKKLDDYASIIICGTGSGAKAVLDFLYQKRLYEKVIIVLAREKDHADQFEGRSVDYEGNMDQYLNDSAAVVIASQYYNQIYDRIITYTSRKIVCFVPNLFCGGTIYTEENVISFEDERYLYLERILEDSYSKELLQNVITYRNQGTEFMDYDVWKQWNGDEDYWKRIRAVRKHKRAIVVDGGAFSGDTIYPLCEAVGEEIIRYYAFEPDKSSFGILESLPKKSNKYKELVPVNAGLWSVDTELIFSEDSTQRDKSSIQENGNQKVYAKALDNIEFEADTDIFIKMDIEGAERDALKGAEKLIKTRKPSLAICCYHKPNDLLCIPLYLKELVPEYKIYLAGGPHIICIAQVE